MTRADNFAIKKLTIDQTATVMGADIIEAEKIVANSEQNDEFIVKLDQQFFTVRDLGTGSDFCKLGHGISFCDIVCSYARLEAYS